jgi:acyl dehydratase
VTARDIELFIELTGDRTPLHHDEARPPASRFGGIKDGQLVLDGTPLVWTERVFPSHGVGLDPKEPQE